MAEVEDTSVYPRMINLASCVCLAMEDAGIDLCFCGVVPGGAPPLDYCGGNCESCPGMAWVRLVTATVPDYAATPGLRSCTQPLEFALEVGFAHCAPMPDSQGNPPGIEAQLEAVRMQTVGMSAMRSAIMCCFAETEDERDVILGPYNPLPTMGGCLAATWAVAIEG